MKTVEIRVRPVVRHVVTRYSSETHPGGLCSGGSESLGEFANEAYAEELAEALRAKVPQPMEYVAVERGFQAATNAIYFDSQEAADRFVAAAQLEGREFRVYTRLLTDPVAIAHRSLGEPDAPMPEVPPRLSVQSNFVIAHPRCKICEMGGRYSAMFPEFGCVTHGMASDALAAAETAKASLRAAGQLSGQLAAKNQNDQPLPPEVR